MSRPLPFRTVELSDPALELDGLRQVTVHSAALQRRADVTVYAPSASGRMPLVVLLHGVYGSHWAWTLRGGAHRVLEGLVAAGRVRPMVLVMPADGLWGSGSGYLPRAGENAEQWIVDEVPLVAGIALPQVEISQVCIAGLSMGGFGALRLAGKYPHRYAAAAGMSSITHRDDMSLFVPESIDHYAVAPGEAGVADVLRAAEELPRIRFDCGRDDALIDANRRLHGELVAAGIGTSTTSSTAGTTGRTGHSTWRTRCNSSITVPEAPRFARTFQWRRAPG